MRLLTSLFLATVLAACAPRVNVQLAWLDPGVTPAPLRSVMVVGIARNAGLRDRYETIAREGFAGSGTAALRSLDLLSPKQPLDKETIEKAIAGRDVQAIFATRLLDVETSQTYVPPSYTPGFRYPSYYGSFYGYAPFATSMVMEPGYFVEKKEYLLESSLWNAETGSLMWTAQTSVIDPNKPDPAFKALMRKLVDELRAAGFLGLAVDS
jgi:hypothetical protein